MITREQAFVVSQRLAVRSIHFALASMVLNLGGGLAAALAMWPECFVLLVLGWLAVFLSRMFRIAAQRIADGP